MGNDSAVTHATAASDGDRLASLRERLDRTVQVVDAAESAGHEGEASDASGSVVVHLGPDGGLASLVVRESWREHHAPAALGAVVRDTYAAAQGARARAAAADLTARLTGPAPATRPLLPDGSSMAERVQQILTGRPAGSTDTAAVTASLSAFVSEAMTALDEGARAAERRRRAEHAGAASGPVAVRVDGDGRLVAVEYDERWLAEASAFTISLETSEAVTEARAAAAAAASQSAAASPILADVARTAADPALLAQRLGLTG